ncbi:MAG TPA: thiamine phosphate synthase [Acidobacteriaceae bacterium]|nr:thiamine phosphate synthase [Acidobacteriaceae bacterium]
MLLYAITDRTQLPGPSDAARRAALVSLAAEWAARNIDYIQIREKDLAPADLLSLSTEIVAAVRTRSTHTRILLNGPATIALEAHANGIHLPANAPLSAAAEARAHFASTGRDAVISYACHSRDQVIRAREEAQLNLDATSANTLILFAPVFGKNISGEAPLPGQGLEALRAAAEAAHPIPVLALGGITHDNAQSCLAAGAAGIAAIRLFLTNNWESLKSAHL